MATAGMVLEILCVKGIQRSLPGGHIGFLMGLKFHSAHPLIGTIFTKKLTAIARMVLETMRMKEIPRLDF